MTFLPIGQHFFNDNDYLEVNQKPFPMPDGMYLLKLKETANPVSAMDQLSTKTEINKIFASSRSI